MVGATGFEPATFCSQSRRDTKLRYAPKSTNSISQYFDKRNMELPSGFEPLIIELQSIALPTWLRKHST